MKVDSTSYGAIRPGWDKNDCSIRAMSCATGCSYEQASVLYSAAGRTLKKGTEVFITAQVCEQWLKMYEVSAGMQLAMFIVMHPKGRFILHVRGHALALVDGVVHDWKDKTKPSANVVKAWRVTEDTLARLGKLAELFS